MLPPLESTFLTTLDNPYDPEQDYSAWRTYDQEHEYYTEEYLARVANLPVDLVSEEAHHRLELAKIEILNNDMLGIYKLI